MLSLKPSTKLIAQIALASVAAVLRLPAELARVDDARLAADAVLDRRHDQRVQPARQHGRALRRHRDDRRRRAARSICCRARPARGRSSRRAISRSCSARPAASSSTTCIRRRSSWATAAACCSGFSFAAVTLSAGHQAPGRSDVLSIVAAPVLVLLIPIFDTTLVTLSRVALGPPRVAGRPRSLVAPARRDRTVGAARRRAALAARRGRRRARRRARPLQPDLVRAAGRGRRSCSRWCSSPSISPASASTTTPTRA